MNKRTLGRGLSELLSTLPPTPPSLVSPTTQTGAQQTLPVEILQPGQYQPRRDIQPEALQELADSIRAQGILQPILVRLLSANRYEIIAGERRWRAAQLAGLQQVPVFIRDISDEAAIAMGLIENIQREDLNAIEQAIALKRLGDEFAMTHEAIATAVGKSRATVSNLLRLLQLAAPVRARLEKGELEMGHARALLALNDPTQQVEAANRVVALGLSVRETERLVRRHAAPTVTQPPRKVDPDTVRLQAVLSDKLGAAVVIQHGSNGKGRLIINYHSLDELDGILAHIK